MPDIPQERDDSLFGAAFMALPEAACILEPIGLTGQRGQDWRYLVCNPAMCLLLDDGDLVGQTLRGRFPHVADRWADDMARVLATGKSEVLIRETSQQLQTLEVVLVPIDWARGKALMVRVRDVTAERLASVQRREADARYKLLFDAIDEGFCVVEVLFDRDGKAADYLFLEANDAFVSQTGFSLPIGKRMRELQPDIEDHWAATYGRIAKTGVPERFESHSGAMDRWFDVFAFPIGERAPFLVGILFEDVGARKQMELALRHSQARLQSLIEATSDIIFRIDAAGTLMQQVGGDCLLGELGKATNWIEEFIPDCDRPRVQEALDSAIRQRTPLELEHRARTPDGAIVWLYSRAVPVLGESGEIVEWFGMATDITERRHVEQQVVHGAQMLRMASEIGKVGLWDWNVETGELTWSDEHFRMEGFAVDEVVPTYEIWAERVHPDDRATAEAKIAEAMASGKDYVNEYRVTHPGGEVRWLSARGRFLFDDRGLPVRMLGAMVDTTQRRREEEWHKLLVAELQHRVRNLIGMVRSVARLSAPSHRQVDDYVDHLIGRLQAMGRTQSTLTRSPGSTVDLAELVREELLVHAARPEQSYIEGPAVALSPHAAEIITLAVHELATNSIKYGALGDTGYIRITWVTSRREDKAWVHLKWQETSPAPRSRLGRKGFGRRLIEERVPYELHGAGRFKLHDTGVLAELEFPLVNAPSILETRS